MIQTRGPLVVRDIDLLQRFQSVQVQFSIPTDDEAIRQAFEPKAPTLERRWTAVRSLKNAAIPVTVCVSPMLPLKNPKQLSQQLRDMQIDRVSVVRFRNGKKRFQANTGERAKQLLKHFAWTDDDYQRCVEVLRTLVPVCQEEAGFAPPPAVSKFQQELCNSTRSVKMPAM